MGEVRPSRISVSTSIGALQIAPDPGKPGVFAVYYYKKHLNKPRYYTFLYLLVTFTRRQHSTFSQSLQKISLSRRNLSNNNKLIYFYTITVISQRGTIKTLGYRSQYHDPIDDVCQALNLESRS